MNNTRHPAHHWPTLLALAALVLLPAVIWLEKTEPKLWQNRLFLPNFTQEENRHTPVHATGTFLPPVITADTLFTADQAPIIVRGSVKVPPDVTLAFAPGTTVYVHEHGQVVVEGSLRLEGTEEQPVTFTTNEAHIANKTWAGIVVRQTADAVISHTTIRYASPAITCQAGSSAAITNTVIEQGNLGMYTESAACRLLDSTIRHVTNGVISIGSQPRLLNTTIQASQKDIQIF